MTGRGHYDTAAIRDLLRISEVMARHGLSPDRAKSRLAVGDLFYICPLHQERSASFHADDRKGLFFCFGCQAKGDVIDLIAQLWGVSMRQAIAEAAAMAGVSAETPDPVAAPLARAKRLLADAVRDQCAGQFPIARRADMAAATEEVRRMVDVVATPEQARAAADRAAAIAGEARRLLAEAAALEDRAKSAEVAMGWWRDAERGASLIATYLRGRGLDPAAIADSLPALRLARLWYRDADEERPAMLAVFQDASGAVTGCHRTFLTPDGRAKADGAAKKMFGTCKDGAIRLSPPAPVLALAEGIETALAYRQWARQARGETVAVWAAGDRGSVVAPDGVCLPDWAQEVRVIVDNDTRIKRDIDAWVEAAAAKFAPVPVQQVVPPRGMDFLDWLNAGGPA